MSSAVKTVPRVNARTWDRIDVIAWSIVGVVTAMRAVAALRVPLIGDEGYYWEWARHLALGYSDHPPGVAYTIFAFSWLGTNPFAVRIGFILCGVAAAIFAAKAAARLTGGDARAGAVTALAITLTPLSSVAFGSASPDGPYLAAWAATLYCAVRAFEAHLRRDYLWLGVAIGAVLLTRIFSFRARLRHRDVRAGAAAAPRVARGLVALAARRGHHVRAVPALELDPRLGDVCLRVLRATRGTLALVRAVRAAPHAGRGLFAGSVDRGAAVHFLRTQRALELDCGSTDHR